MERLADLAIRHRGALLAACGGITILALAGLAQLRFQEEPRDIYRSDNDDFQRLEKVYRDFGADDNDCLILVEANDLFTPAASGHLRGLVTQLSELEGVQRVLGLPHVITFSGPALPRPLYPGPSASPETFEAARRAARAHPMVDGVMLAPDGRATLLSVRLTGGSLHVTDVEERTGPIRNVLTRWENDSGFRARLTGIPPIRVAVLRLIERSTVLFTVIGTTCCIILCFLIFRNLRALLITAAGPVLGCIWSVGMLGWFGVEMDLVMTVMPTLVMAIGFTDSVHLMVDMRESVAKGKSGPEAARLAIARLGIPCALTSFTTAVGFASLAQAQVGIIQRFGLASMGGVLLTFLVVITCVPLCVSFFPRIIPKRSREAGTKLRGIVKGFTGFILDYPRTWSLVGENGNERIRTAITGIRDQFFSIYGVSASLDLGFTVTIPETGTALLEHITYLYERLSNPLIALPEPAPGRLPIDLAAQLLLIKPFIDELRLLVDTHEDQKRKTNDATVQKDDAVTIYDRDFSGLAASTQGMFRMAKMPRQARFVRPIRRRGVTVVAGEEPPVDPASGAGSPPEPAPAAESL